MRWRGILICMAFLVSGCGSSAMEVVVTAPDGVPSAATDAVVRILDQRLMDMVGDSARVESTEQGIVIALPEGTDPAIVDLATAQGYVSIQPVLDVLTEMLDPPTGATDLEYMIDSLGFVYHVGPSFLEARHFVDGRASSIEGLGPASTWVVEPTLSETGRRSFVEATKTLATYPGSSPRRQMAIVLDGRVLSAPQLAPEVDPDEDLDPDVMVFTISEGPMVEERARALATYLRYGPLPVPLEMVDQ